MKKALSPIVAAALLLAGGSAFAADLPTTKAPPAPPPPAPWKGFYVGLNAGGLWSNSGSAQISSYPLDSDLAYGGNAANAIYATSLNGPVRVGSTNGFIGGGQVGYNWQPGLMNNNLIFGFEADIQGVVVTGSKSRVVNNLWATGNPAGGSLWNNLGANGNMNFFGTVRGRLGYLVNPTLLVYGTGGLAYGGVNGSVNLTQYVFNSSGVGQMIANANANYSDVPVGWTGGGGVEWMFMQNWSAKVEYLYYDLGSSNLDLNSFATKLPGSTFSLPGSGLTSAWTASTINVRNTGNLVRAGVNYHINLTPAASPVVAKY
jgi:outer membrane immunogenic protein